MDYKFNIEAAKNHLSEAVTLIRKGASESVIRNRFVAHLENMFPEKPWWVNYHGLGSESHVTYKQNGEIHRGFVDTLVGLTAVEYKNNILRPNIFNHGFDQVKDYCAGLLNSGCPSDLVIGILSDTVHWRAYKISAVVAIDTSHGEIYGRHHLTLEETERLDLESADERSALLIGEFLSKYLGREGCRPLGADALANDLGFESAFCEGHISRINNLVDSAFSSNKKYANLIEKLWCNFISYFGDSYAGKSFDKDLYVRELYLLTLAKLLCANVIEKKSLISDDMELKSILNGSYFKLKGLTNLVEYDYFGWLNEEPHIEALIPIAKAIQDDLRAYDFRAPPVKDLFGAMMAQLAKGPQRLLLGQEWTPEWLSTEVVGKVFENLPRDGEPCLVDVCCGSGTMIVEAIKLRKAQLDSEGSPKDAKYVSKMVQTITGFDIDPLSVMLSKVGWVIAARDRLEPFGFFQISIPVYHADSLFVTTPLTQKVDEETGTTHYDLLFDDKIVSLPKFIVSPEYRILFDALLNIGYEMAMSSAQKCISSVTKEDISELLAQAIKNTGTKLGDEENEVVLSFCSDLVETLEVLQREGRNGIWAFVLRNGYRPGLVAGQFNGLVSNPPWMALSKIADNPYKEGLREKAEYYNIKPRGSSHLHIEIATIFLLHSVNHYLKDGSAVGCILPETVLSGHHHNPFRKGAFLSGMKPVTLSIDELWRIEKGTFKNEAIILFGKKEKKDQFVPSTIPGNLVSVSGHTPLSFNQMVQGKRTAWSDTLSPLDNSNGFFRPAEFRQGADIMPRTLIFHEATQICTGQWRLFPIDRQQSKLRYLVTSAKKYRDFKLQDCVVPDRFIFDVFISNHLTPFNLIEPVKAPLPIIKDDGGHWTPVRTTFLATQNGSKQAFDQIFSIIGNNIGPDDFFRMLDSNRHKLTTQLIPSEGWIVFMGAGGNYVCSAYVDAKNFSPEKLIIDQTLYWAEVATEDEAIYLTGLLNSEAVNMVIKEFQPRGQFGPRHVHKLPIGVTPKYNPLDSAHIDVVEKTRQLLNEWNLAKSENSNILALLDPNKPLPQRRRKLRTLIQSLSTYPDYALAARNLYGI